MSDATQEYLRQRRAMMHAALGEVRRPAEDIRSDFERGIPPSMDGERKRRTPEAEAQIAAAREECGLSAGHAGAHFRGEHLGPEGDACGRPVDEPQCLGTYGSNHGVPLRCSPAAGCGLGGCPCVRPKIDLGPLPTMEQMQDQTPRIVLTGADMAVFDEFSLAAAALEAHAEQQPPLQQRYRTALEAMSRMAAKRNRGG